MSTPTFTDPPDPAPNSTMPDEIFDPLAFALVDWFPLMTAEHRAGIVFVADSVDAVDADATAVETARQQVVLLEGRAEDHRDQAALSAAASATTGIDANALPIGSKLIVIPDGAGGRLLSMHPGAVPQKIVSQTGAAITFDLSAAPEFKAVLDQDATITFDVSGLDAQAGTSYPFEFSVIQGATKRIVTWGSTVKFDNDVEAAQPDALQRAHYVGKYDVDEAVFYLWQTARTPV